MNSKERMLTALNLGKADRVPATIHQWQDFHLKNFMDGMSDIEAFRAVGLDASVTVGCISEEASPDWRLSSTEHFEGRDKMTGYSIATPAGKLTYQTGSNEITTWITDHLIKKEEDIYLLKYQPVPSMDKKAVEKAYDEVGDDGIIRVNLIGYAQGGCWQDACELYGVEKMIFATFDNPEWVHEFLNILLDWKLKFIEKNYGGIKADLCETGGGASSCTVISPSVHEEFCLPYDKKLHDAIRSLGLKTTYHTCGGMTKILDLIVQNGCDASETLSPVGVGGDITDAGPVLEKFSSKLAMIGGLDQFNILTSGTAGDIKKEVVRLFETFGAKGGYIMSASDHFFHAPKENLTAYANAARECRY